MIKREIEIDGRKVPFRASAAIPRLYRAKFGRDIFKDLTHLEKNMKTQEQEDSGSSLSVDSLELFENVAYIMAKHADPAQPEDITDWLDQFSTFSIYQVLPELLEMWHLNVQTDVQAKKNRNRVTGK